MKPGFGDYVRIEMKRYGAPNEMYLHKVVGLLQSSHAASVPIDHGIETGTGTDPVRLGKIQDVLNVIQCGVDETRVFKVAVKDVEMSNHDLSFASCLPADEWRGMRDRFHAAIVEKCGDAIGGFDPDQRST